MERKSTKKITMASILELMRPSSKPCRAPTGVALRRPDSIIRVGIPAGLMFAAMPLSAIPILYSEVELGLVGEFGLAQQVGPIQATNASLGPFEDTLTQTFDQVNRTTLASSMGYPYGFVENGVLRSEVSATGGYYLQRFPGGSPSTFNFATTAGADSRVRFGDTITLFSTSLPIGAPVTFQLTLSPSYSVVGGCQTIPDPDAIGGTLSAEFEFQALAAVKDSSLNLVGGLLSQYGGCGQTTVVSSATYQGLVGEQYLIESQLFTWVRSESMWTPIGIDATNSLEFFIDPLGDFSYTTQSGNTYFSPSAVPEPSSGFLLAGGLALAIGLRRSRRTTCRGRSGRPNLT